VLFFSAGQTQTRAQRTLIDFHTGAKKNEVPGIVIFSVVDEGNFVSKGGPIYASVTGLNFSQLNEINFPSKRQRI
jgi:hypothetical protein